jgi:hypothetical protein
LQQEEKSKGKNRAKDRKKMREIGFIILKIFVFVQRIIIIFLIIKKLDFIIIMIHYIL